jgi:protein SCO1/2
MTQGRHTGPRWWIAAALAVILLAGGGLWVRSRLAPPPLEGAVLTPPVRAYDFELPDPDGRMISLASMRGKVVALTFLYAHCPDYCPLVADQINKVHVDPAGDTPDAVREFLDAHHVTGVLTYVRGTWAQLRPVWAHYFVASDAKEGTSASDAAAHGVSHTTILYIIDPQGQVRVFLPANFDPKDLLTDVRLLARSAR